MYVPMPSLSARAAWRPSAWGLPRHVATQRACLAPMPSGRHGVDQERHVNASGRGGQRRAGLRSRVTTRPALLLLCRHSDLPPTSPCRSNGQETLSRAGQSGFVPAAGISSPREQSSRTSETRGPGSHMGHAPPGKVSKRIIQAQRSQSLDLARAPRGEGPWPNPARKLGRRWRGWRQLATPPLLTTVLTASSRPEGGMPNQRKS